MLTPASTPPEIALRSRREPLVYGGENDDDVAKITTAGSSPFPVLTASSAPAGITTGPNGSLSFTEEGRNGVREVHDGGRRRSLIPTSPGGPRQIVAGPDGNLWFHRTRGKQDRPDHDRGVIIEFTVPTAAATPRYHGRFLTTTFRSPRKAATDQSGPQRPASSPSSRSPPPPCSRSPSRPVAQTVTWFSEEAGNNVGADHHGPSIVSETQTISLGGLEVAGITAGPDGDMVVRTSRTTRSDAIHAGPMTPKAPRRRRGRQQHLRGRRDGLGRPIVEERRRRRASVTGGITGSAAAEQRTRSRRYRRLRLDRPRRDDGLRHGHRDTVYSLHIAAASRPAVHWDAEVETLWDGTIEGSNLRMSKAHQRCRSPPVLCLRREHLPPRRPAGRIAAGSCPTTASPGRGWRSSCWKAARLDFVPPSCTSEFADVTCPSIFADSIEQLLGGADHQQVCGRDRSSARTTPSPPMSAFPAQVRAQLRIYAADVRGSSQNMPCPSLFADWIEQLAAEITGRLRHPGPLSGQPQHPGPDGRLPGEDVRPPALRAVGEAGPAGNE